MRLNVITKIALAAAVRADEEAGLIPLRKNPIKLVASNGAVLRHVQPTELVRGLLRRSEVEWGTQEKKQIGVCAICQRPFQRRHVQQYCGRCHAPGCERKADKGSHCNTHTTQLKRHGKTPPIRRRKRTVQCVARFTDGALCGRKTKSGRLCAGHAQQTGGYRPIMTKAEAIALAVAARKGRTLNCAAVLPDGARCGRTTAKDRTLCGGHKAQKVRGRAITPITSHPDSEQPEEKAAR